jgi:arginase family enzyme
MQVLSLPELAVLPPEAMAQVAAASPEVAKAVAAVPHPDTYLHFDVDSLDPACAPGVHYRVGGGFDASEVATLAGYLSAGNCVRAITVASANLDHDVDGRTVDAIRVVLTSVADALAAVTPC